MIGVVALWVVLKLSYLITCGAEDEVEVRNTLNFNDESDIRESNIYIKGENDNFQNARRRMVEQLDRMLLNDEQESQITLNDWLDFAGLNSSVTQYQIHPAMRTSSRNLQSLNRCSRLVNPFCLCSAEELRKAIRNASTRERFPTRLNICSGKTIELKKPIDVTGRSFYLGCFPIKLGGTCGLTGGFDVSSGPAIVGKPAFAYFFGLFFDSFNNTEVNGTLYANGGKGGALYLTGGRTRLYECQFYWSEAIFGGAAYIAGKSTRLELAAQTVSGNVAYESGGGVYVAHGAHLESRRSGMLNNIASKYGGFAVIDNATAHIFGAIYLNNTASDGFDLYVIRRDKNRTKLMVDCKTPRWAYFQNEHCDGTTDGIVVNDGSKMTDCVERALVDTDSFRCERLRRISGSA